MPPVVPLDAPVAGRLGVWESLRGIGRDIRDTASGVYNRPWLEGTSARGRAGEFPAEYRAALARNEHLSGVERMRVSKQEAQLAVQRNQQGGYLAGDQATARPLVEGLTGNVNIPVGMSEAASVALKEQTHLNLEALPEVRNALQAAGINRLSEVGRIHEAVAGGRAGAAGQLQELQAAVDRGVADPTIARNLEHGLQTRGQNVHGKAYDKATAAGTRDVRQAHDQVQRISDDLETHLVESITSRTAARQIHTETNNVLQALQTAPNMSAGEVASTAQRLSQHIKEFPQSSSLQEFVQTEMATLRNAGKVDAANALEEGLVRSGFARTTPIADIQSLGNRLRENLGSGRLPSELDSRLLKVMSEEGGITNEAAATATNNIAAAQQGMRDAQSVLNIKKLDSATRTQQTQLFLQHQRDLALYRTALGDANRNFSDQVNAALQNPQVVNRLQQTEAEFARTSRLQGDVGRNLGPGQRLEDRMILSGTLKQRNAHAVTLREAITQMERNPNALTGAHQEALTAAGLNPVTATPAKAQEMLRVAESEIAALEQGGGALGAPTAEAGKGGGAMSEFFRNLTPGQAAVMAGGTGFGIGAMGD